MWRALVFIGLLCVAAFAAGWLADQPGEVLVTFGGYRIETTVAVAAIALVGIGFLLAVLWAMVNALLKLPTRITFASRARRRARGYQAVSRGMVAVGAGDTIAARRHAGEAERLLGEEPLTLLLKAQAAQVSGNRIAAEGAFRRMMDDDETRVLGLRGLFVEARRQGDVTAARSYAAEAARLAPAATWANEAMLEAQCAEGDWRGAIATIERRASLGLIDKATAKRHRAVLLTADALARKERDPHGALSAALDAVKLSPSLVPAAALAGRLLGQRGDLKRAAKILETTWRTEPHPEIADVYLYLRSGDSALDRLKRAETLAKISSWHPEARLAVARAAMEAREFERARAALEPLLAERPSMRVALLMADLEQAEHGTTGRAREWLARASRAPRDPAWIADGVVADRWGPVSPVTGRIDAFVWQAPPDVLVAPELQPIDDVVADLDDKPKALPASQPEPAEVKEEITAPASAEADTPAPAEAAPTVSSEPVSVPVPTKAAPPATETRPTDGTAEPRQPEAELVKFPDRPPDDPGPMEEDERKTSRFRIF